MSESVIPTLVVMARWPASGRCKRRLAADIGSEAAAHIQQRLSGHTFTVAEALSQNGEIDLQVAISGVSLRSSQRWLGSLPPCMIVDQGRGTLGARMLRQIHLARQNQGHKPVILIGTDLATLTQSDIRHAIASLQEQQLVIGPSDDGGYWLLGIGTALSRSKLDKLFFSVPWGSNKVFEITSSRAQELGLNPHQLVSKNDIDCLADLRLWHA